MTCIAMPAVAASSRPAPTAAAKAGRGRSARLCRLQSPPAPRHRPPPRWPGSLHRRRVGLDRPCQLLRAAAFSMEGPPNERMAAILILAWWADDAHTVMAGEGPPSTPFALASRKRRGWVRQEAGGFQ